MGLLVFMGGGWTAKTPRTPRKKIRQELILISKPKSGPEEKIKIGFSPWRIFLLGVLGVLAVNPHLPLLSCRCFSGYRNHIDALRRRRAIVLADAAADAAVGIDRY